MKKTKDVLIVDASPHYGRFLARAIEQELDTGTYLVNSLGQLDEVLTKSKDCFFCAIVDLNLTGSSDEKAVEKTVAARIPTIVISDPSCDTELRNNVLALNVLDFLLKGARVLERLLTIIRRQFRYDPMVKVLVVDDDRTSRVMIKRQLKKSQYQLLEASDGCEALLMLEEHVDIKLVVTDYHMPNMDGFDLTAKIRQRYNQDELAVIGLSSSSSSDLAARFLKLGANDFLQKGFSLEEFKLRVRQNIALVEHFSQIRETANRDSLTQLYNRGYFFKAGRDMFEMCGRAQSPFALAMMDIDHFKNFNDEYGHDAGDMVLCELGMFLKKRCRKSDIVARYGGEEFTFLATNITLASVASLFDQLRRDIADLRIKWGSHVLQFTLSIGVATTPRDSFEDMLKEADRLMYQAKDAGRNRIMVEDASS